MQTLRRHATALSHASRHSMRAVLLLLFPHIFLFYSDKISISDSLFSHRLGAGTSCVFPKSGCGNVCEPVNYILHCCGRQRALHSIRECKLIKTWPQKRAAYAKFKQKMRFIDEDKQSRRFVDSPSGSGDEEKMENLLGCPVRRHRSIASAGGGPK